MGFEYGDEVDEILGAEKRDTGLYFYVAWKNKDEVPNDSGKSKTDNRRRCFVLGAKCNNRCPQKVIKFYESRLYFESAK